MTQPSVPTSTQIRAQFLDYFRDKEHTVVPSSSVVPHDDPTLLFTNAGMNQFKDVFLGTGSRDYRRATDTQKCIRAGGKHNDLDDVGQDTYHHTFFEMLGNWSFGDYFKEDAIRWAWDLLTNVWGIEKDRLYATYFEGDRGDNLEPDEEARRLWAEATDIDPTHIVPGDKKDNFWEMGETGPCGPSSELHIDLTPDKSGGALVNKDDHRVMEIWNLVFIQFNRGTDGTLSALPAKHVDTGMGFERICSVLQGKTSNYDTDVFMTLFDAIQKRTGAPDYTGKLPHLHEKGADDTQLLVDVSYRVIADHLRTLTFAITDGATVSNEGRGYVLRRILRRAVRYGRQYLGMEEPFLCDLVDALVDQLGETFPELRSARKGKNPEHVRSVLREEEVSFGRTLERGIRLFEGAAVTAEKHHHGRVSGADAFKLHDTYGFPIDLTEQMAEERALTIDIGEYERLMEAARERARSTGGAAQGFDMNISASMPSTDDSAKHASEPVSATLLGYVADGQYHSSGSIPAAGLVALVLDRTAFYGEQGGQVGDRGTIESEHALFDVVDTKCFGETILHIGSMKDGSAELGIGDAVTAVVESENRPLTMKNHTSTHILNWALREVLGDEVHQKGSLVDAEKTRFDLSHPRPVSGDELEKIESLVNEQIDRAAPVHVAMVAQADALEIESLRAVFGEKYPDPVRVVSVGASIDDLLAKPKDAAWMGHAVEFCGGTHLSNSGEAERFALVSEEGVAKGVRRVVGVTAELARTAHANGARLLDALEAARSVKPEQVKDSIASLTKELSDTTVPVYVRQRIQAGIGELQKAAREAEKSQAAESGSAVQDRVAELLESASEVAGIRIVAGDVPQAPVDALRTAVDWVRDKAGSAVVLLASAVDGKVTLLAGVSADAVGKGLKAGDLIKEVAPLVGGRGGGRPDMAQGGGSDPAGIPEAIERVSSWATEKLG